MRFAAPYILCVTVGSAIVILEDAAASNYSAFDAEICNGIVQLSLATMHSKQLRDMMILRSGVDECAVEQHA